MGSRPEEADGHRLPGATTVPAGTKLLPGIESSSAVDRRGYAPLGGAVTSGGRERVLPNSSCAAAANRLRKRPESDVELTLMLRR